MDECQFEGMEHCVVESTGVVEHLEPEAPGPINLSDCGWPAVLAFVVVATTTLAFDFAAFRAAELSRRNGGRESSASLQQQELQQQQEHSGQQAVANGGGGFGIGVGGSGAGSSTGGGHGGDTVQVTVRSRHPSSSSARSSAEESWMHRRRACVIAGWILGALIFHRMDLMVLARVSATIGAFVGCLPYFLRPSKYRRDQDLGCVLEASDKRRPFSDMLVWTSLVYCVPSIYGLYAHQYGIAALQFMTTIGSTLFHLTRETKYFNLDNVFATSLLSTTMWGFYLAVRHGIWWYAATVGLGGPVAVFCIVRCGMPGLVCKHPSGHGLCRKSNPEYDFFHMLWHLSSGVGTLISIHFFEVHFPAEDAGGGWFSCFPDVPVVPTVALTMSGLINFYGNYVGVMPLE